MNRRPDTSLPLSIAFATAAFGLAALPVRAADPAPRTARRVSEQVLVAAAAQPAEFRYPAFPSLLRTGPDEVWLAFKAGRSHATDAGASLEVVRHTLSTGATKLIQRLTAPGPKIYQMGELTRLPDGTVALYLDVQSVGWDGRHYRSGAEVYRWLAAEGKFGAAEALAPINGVLYGYPFDFVSEGRTTWQLIMAFGYHLPGGRWSVDVVRSEDAGHSWRFVRNLAEEFGGLKINESGFARHGDGFIVATRGYDRVARLHRSDGDFRVRRQVDLSGKHPLINNLIGRPRVFVRDGQGYLIGRNWTRPTSPTAAGRAGANPMQLCLIRFDPETLAVSSVVVLDNADHQNVSDGYYAVTTFAGEGAQTLLHVFTYKAMGGKPPDIVRFDYRWAEVR
jgi:hypothetical protein